MTRTLGFLFLYLRLSGCAHADAALRLIVINVIYINTPAELSQRTKPRVTRRRRQHGGEETMQDRNNKRRKKGIKSKRRRRCTDGKFRVLVHERVRAVRRNVVCEHRHGRAELKITARFNPLMFFVVSCKIPNTFMFSHAHKLHKRH